MAKRMRGADVFIAPSVTASDGDMEGIPTTIMEAMATGLVVISTVHSGIPELVQDGLSGLLCAERDFAKIADQLLFLAANRELWADFGREARKVVERDFNIESQNRRVIELYRELLSLHQEEPGMEVAV